MADLALANAGGEFVRPVYAKLYSAKSAYGLESLFPADWDQLVRRFMVDDEAFSQYYRYYFGDDPRTGQVWDESIRKRMVCAMVSTIQGDDRKCHSLFS